jgi:hypothetical protein
MGEHLSLYVAQTPSRSPMCYRLRLRLGVQGAESLCCSDSEWDRVIPWRLRLRLAPLCHCHELRAQGRLRVEIGISERETSPPGASRTARRLGPRAGLPLPPGGQPDSVRLSIATLNQIFAGEHQIFAGEHFYIMMLRVIPTPSPRCHHDSARLTTCDS